LALSLALKPAVSASTWYQGKNITMSRMSPLTAATISPKLIREVSTVIPPERERD